MTIRGSSPASVSGRRSRARSSSRVAVAPDGPLREGGNEVAGEPSGVLEHVIAPIHPLQA